MIYMPLEEIIDLSKEIERIRKNLNKIEEQIQKSELKLSGAFAHRASPEIVQKERENLKELKAKKIIVEEQLEDLQ